MKQLYSVLLSLFLFLSSFGQNPIVIENALPGTPIAEWGVPNFRDTRIAGFSTRMSLNSGETVRFKINVEAAAAYTLKIYRIGYYGGNGARLVADLGVLNGVVQPAGISDAVTGILDCGNWSESASWPIPASAVSGFYIAKLERTGGGSNHIAFVVRNDASTSDLYFQMPDATWQAYNGYGGNSLYDGNTSFPNGHAVKVSYNRPFFPYNSLFNTDGRESDWYMNAVYPMIRWLERNGYDISYTSCNDVDRNGARLLNHKVFLSVGHDEYWSKNHRNNVEAARDAGVNLAFFSGNEVYWKTRWEANDGAEDRTLVCYKEGLLADGTNGERACGTKCDVSSSEWTGLWRTGEAFDAGKPENALTGQISWTEVPSEIGVPANYQKLRFWRNTSITGLLPGQTAFLGVNTLGHEWDFEQPAFASSNPAGRFTLSNRTVSSRTHKLSLYRHSSGALVFGAGTVQWSWGLDGNHLGGSNIISAEMQQATVNLFADMNTQPGSLQPGLTTATKTTDISAPLSSIVMPANGSSGAIGTPMEISGTVADNGNGVVAAVEVSTDGGTTWTSAEIDAADQSLTWSFTWVPGNEGNAVIKVRGVDDSGNLEVPGGGINVSISPDVCPCNIFPVASLPLKPLNNDAQSIEVGVKFRSSQNGYISGIRYYKGTGTTGTHTGSLWNSSGTLLATATFTSETASGWQEVLFASPVAITAGVTYVASSFSPSGDYASSVGYFTQAVVNGSLTGLADGEDGPNGVYIYSPASAFPINDFNATNYWVDVVFTKTLAGLPPDITLQPASQSLCEGATASFNSEAGGSPLPTIQWQSSMDGITWTDISGAVSSTLSFVVTLGDNNKLFRAVWTNPEGPVYSNPALLTVTAGGPVLTSSLSASVTSGELFIYTPTSADPATVFTWSRALVSGISNPAANGSGGINETLISTSSVPVQVTYEYTLALNTCSHKENLVVTVNPLQGAPCINTASIKHHFNSNSIQAGRYIWFSSSFKTTGTAKHEKESPLTIYVTNSRISFVAYGRKYSLAVPDSRISFVEGVTSASTQFINDIWVTTVPLGFKDDVFMGGLSYLVPSRIPRNTKNITWTADVSMDRPGVSLHWQWGAAVYSRLGGHDGLAIKPVSGWKDNPYLNKDEAGTPENYKQYLVTGDKGKKHGKDYTGQHSKHQKISCKDGRGDDDDNKPNGKPPFKSLPNKISPAHGLEVMVGPNPSSGYFSVQVQSKNNAPITVRILDSYGKEMEKYERVSSSGTLRVGDSLKTGLYFLEVIQGGARKTVSILKI